MLSRPRSRSAAVARETAGEPGLNWPPMSSSSASPSAGKITISGGVLHVPDHPVIPYIEGDGTGRDIWRSSQAVFDAAVEKAFKGKKKIVWHEVLAGEKAFNQTKNWLPDETVTAFRD